MDSCHREEGIWWGPAVILTIPIIIVIPQPCMREFWENLNSSHLSLSYHPPGWNTKGRSSQKCQLLGQLRMVPKKGSLSIWRTSYLGDIRTCDYYVLTHLHLNHSCVSYFLLPLACFIIPVAFNILFLLIFTATYCSPPKYCSWCYNQPEVCCHSRDHVCYVKSIQESICLASLE